MTTNAIGDVSDL